MIPFLFVHQFGADPPAALLDETSAWEEESTEVHNEHAQSNRHRSTRVYLIWLAFSLLVVSAAVYWIAPLQTKSPMKQPVSRDRPREVEPMGRKIEVESSSGAVEKGVTPTVESSTFFDLFRNLPAGFNVYEDPFAAISLLLPDDPEVTVPQLFPHYRSCPTLSGIYWSCIYNNLQGVLHLWQWKQYFTYQQDKISFMGQLVALSDIVTKKYLKGKLWSENFFKKEYLKQCRQYPPCFSWLEPANVAHYIVKERLPLVTKLYALRQKEGNLIKEECGIWGEYERVPTLDAIRIKISTHFQKPTRGPIIVDNGDYSFLLLGIKMVGSEIYYLLVDPHFFPGDYKKEGYETEEDKKKDYEKNKMITWRSSASMYDDKGKHEDKKTIEKSNTMFLFIDFPERVK